MTYFSIQKSLRFLEQEHNYYILIHIRVHQAVLYSNIASVYNKRNCIHTLQYSVVPTFYIAHITIP